MLRQYHPSVLKNSFLSYFSLTRCFSAAHVSGKTEMRREPAEIGFGVYRQTVNIIFGMRNAELNEFFDGFLNIEVKKHQISYRETKNLTRVPRRM